MAENKELMRKFLELDSSMIPLIKVDYSEVKYNTINPVTNQPYQGIILKGVFADLSNFEINNNNRYYDVPSYLMMVADLRKKVFSKRGVYGELEHPDSYAVNYNNVSHKILDLWYDEGTKCVLGYVMLLNTENGKKAQEIIFSGGALAISGRAAGKEFINPDGSILATTKLLTTYDIVYHPGFTKADLEYVELNESLKLYRESDDGFRVKLYQDQLVGINNEYEKFVSLKESDCFLKWYSKMNESQDFDKQDQQMLQENTSSDENQKERKLQDATNKDLKQSIEIKKKLFNQSKESINNISGRYSHLGKSVYDGSAGFLTFDNLTQNKKK